MLADHPPFTRFLDRSIVQAVARVVGLVASLCLSFIVCGQVPLFTNLTEKEGLVFNEVHSMCFDRRDVLWIGTAMGLSRYDGSKFKTYTTEDGLPAPRVFSIALDDKGMLWMTTPEGLVRMDPVTESIVHWSSDSIPALRTNTSTLIGAWPFSNGKVLATSHQGSWLFDPASGKFNELLFPDGHVVRGIWSGSLPDSAGRGSWLTTSDRGLCYFDAMRTRLLWKDNNPKDHPLLRGHMVARLARDRQGRIWADEVKTGGFLRYDPSNGHLEEWPSLPGHPDRVYPYGTNALHCDDKGRLWVGTWEHPPLIYDPADGSVIDLPYDLDDPAALYSIANVCIIENKRGQIWLGGLRGISVHDPYRFAFEHYDMRELLGDSSAFVYGMDEDMRGDLWFATERGLFCSQNGQSKHLVLDRRQPHLRAFEVVYADSVVWVGTETGLFRVDPFTGNTAQVVPGDHPELKSLSAGSVEADPRGRIWAMRKGGLIECYDPVTNTSRVFERDSTLVHGPPPGSIYDMLCAKDGSIWFAHNTSGLVHMDATTGACTDNLGDVELGRVKGSRLLALAEDPDGRIWYLVDGFGLVRYEPGTGRYTTYDARHGLPVPAGGCINFDEQGVLWVGLINGVARFDPRTERFARIDIARGQIIDDVRYGLMRSNGELWMVDDDLVLRMRPATYKPYPAPSAPQIMHVSAMGERMAPSVDGVIALDHHQDNLRISYTSFDLPGRIVRYASRMDEDSTWSESDEGELNLNHLQPGDHTVQLRALAEDGQWSDPTELRIRMAPPWWQTIWARIVFGLMLAGAIVLVFRARLNWIRKRERAQEEQTRQVNELKLQALRAQMDPHFIFNCLNSIDGYIVSNDPQRASHYLGRFAKLIRLILQYSDSSAIPLEKEVEMLKHYLELEAQRFKDPFAFEVIMDEELMDEAVEIPTMLVQPFVENAIWHGLQHKKEQGRLRVRFSLKEDELVCTVEDDGVGRAASRIINEGREKTHKSMGMRVSSDRLNLLKQHGRQAARVDIEDLQDPTGTRVTIHIPLHSSEHTEE